MDSDSDEETELEGVIDWKEALRLQHAELEMLESMYPADLTIADAEAVHLFKTFVEDLEDSAEQSCSRLPSNLAFSLRVDCGEDEEESIDLSVILPSIYPYVKPTLMLRTSLGKQQEKLFKSSIDFFLSSHADGELYIANVIDYIQENYGSFQTMKECLNDDSEANTKSEPFTRLWIYSHHIYSMQKRKLILEWSRDLGLTGFSLPGKPGIVCVEGTEGNADEFWHRLRRLNWKRLAMKERERHTTKDPSADGADGDDDEETEPRKFDDFQEISFEVKQGHGRNYHMDMGKFLDFLKEHECEHIFKMYFGVDGAID